MSDIQYQVENHNAMPTHFAQIPNIAVIDLTPNAYILLGALIRTIWNGGASWKSQATLAKEIGYSVPTLRKARNALVKHGYIHVESRVNEGKTDVITLLNKWQENADRNGGIEKSNAPPAKNLSTPCKESFYKKESFNKTKEKEKDTPPISETDTPQSKPTADWKHSDWVRGHSVHTVKKVPRGQDVFTFSSKCNSVYRAWQRALTDNGRTSLQKDETTWRNNLQDIKTLAESGIAPYRVYEYVCAQYKDSWWQGKTVTLKNVLGNIATWEATPTNVQPAPEIYATNPFEVQS